MIGSEREIHSQVLDKDAIVDVHQQWPFEKRQSIAMEASDQPEPRSAKFIPQLNAFTSVNATGTLAFSKSGEQNRPGSLLSPGGCAGEDLTACDMDSTFLCHSRLSVVWSIAWVLRLCETTDSVHRASARDAVLNHFPPMRLSAGFATAYDSAGRSTPVRWPPSMPCMTNSHRANLRSHNGSGTVNSVIDKQKQNYPDLSFFSV
jgi:hypothetical protein